MRTIADLLPEMAGKLQLATERLFDHPRMAGEHARRVKKLENEVETVCRTSLAEILSGREEISYLMEMPKAREVLRHMSNASDQGDRAADITLDIGIEWY